MFRRILFWTHLVTGLVTGAVVLLMCVTGVLLTYEKQMLAWADRDAVSGPALGSEELLEKLPGSSGITLHSDVRSPVNLNTAQGAVAVNASTGLPVTPGGTRMRIFFRAVTDWHRWLGAAGANRNTARALTGAAKLGFLFLVISGLYLWMPRKWSWGNVRAVLWFRGGLEGKARNFNWHNAAGFWCCVPLFFVVLSGVVISYPWASDLVYRANGTAPPARGKGKGAPLHRGGSAEGLNALVANVQAAVPGWRTMSVQVPAATDTTVVFNVDTGNGGQPQKRSTITVNRSSGEILRQATYGDQEAGQRARSWMRFVHTGEYYGVFGQTVAGIASAGGALLAWTGFALAYRRFRNWKAR